MTGRALEMALECYLYITVRVEGLRKASLCWALRDGVSGSRESGEERSHIRGVGRGLGFHLHVGLMLLARTLKVPQILPGS